MLKPSKAKVEGSATLATVSPPKSMLPNKGKPGTLMFAGWNEEENCRSDKLFLVLVSKFSKANPPVTSKKPLPEPPMLFTSNKLDAVP